MSAKSLGLCAWLAVMLSGCATAQQTYVVDTFCGSPASKKRTYNPERDTPEQMREIVTWNRYVDRRCGIPRRKNGMTSQNLYRAHNAAILERIRGVPAQAATPETDADPRNPQSGNVRNPALQSEPAPQRSVSPLRLVWDASCEMEKETPRTASRGGRSGYCWA